MHSDTTDFNPSAAAAGAQAASASDTLSLSIREHDVGFFLPPRAVLNNSRLELPHGALLCGSFDGDLICEAGSVIITKDCRFCGSIEADRIYIEGDVASVRERRSLLIGRVLVAAGATARINADLKSRNFAVHKAKIWGRLLSWEEGPSRIE